MIARAVDRWNTNFLRNELWVALAVGALFIAWAECFEGLPQLSGLLAKNRGALYGAIASVAGALLGFELATITILLGYADRRSLRPLKASPAYPVLWKTYTSSIRVLAITTILAIVALIFDRDETPTSSIVYLLFGASVLSVLRVFRSIQILERVVGVVVGLKS